MAPIKFEENIKDKLEQRVLKPSPDAWNTLSAKLDAEPENKTNNRYWWLGIAASFVGLLVVSSILFSGDADATISTPVIVESDIDGAIKPEKEASNKTLDKVITEDTRQMASEQIKTEIVKVNQPVVKTNIPVIKNKVEDLAFTPEPSIEKKSVETVITQGKTITESIVRNETPEDKKVNAVVAQIQKLQKEKSSVTDAEINALLDQAQEELMAERLYNQSTKTVDAELLLLQVETDLDQSFRERVFKALKSGYNTVKTAVAERNN